MNLEVDNLTQDVTQDGRIVLQPSYIAFLASQGYTIEEIKEAHSVPSESDNGKAYLVVKVATYRYPKDDSRLDLVEDKIELTCCSCWSYRQNSNDVRDGELPGGDCKHVRKAFREKRAKQDQQQEELL
jgi:DNA-binding transcriptional MerR regulator